MNLLFAFIVHFYLILPNCAMYKNWDRIKTKNAIDGYNSTKSETTTSPTPMDDKDIEYPVLKKKMTIETNKCNCTCSKNAENSSTETIRKTPPGLKFVMRNKPEKYSGDNATISRMCPYFVPNAGFKMYKMAAVYWPKFYNLKDKLNCFMINVLRLTETEMKKNELIYGNFSGEVDWSQCHFEIKPELFYRKRHFLMGGVEDSGVMRNILISYDSNGKFTLEEEAPDQWVMLRNLVLLRDCMTGEVVVFTRSLQLTTPGDIVQALQYLGEEMMGKTLCDEDNVWSDQRS